MYDLQQQANRHDMAAAGLMFIPKAAGMVAFAMWLLNVLAFPFEAIMRHNFGERYFTLNNMVLSLLVAAPVGVIFGAAGFLSYYLGLAVLLGAYHLVVIWRRRRDGDMWYSYYDGTPWLAHVLPLHEATVQRFVEPAAGLLGIALLAWLFDLEGAGSFYFTLTVAASVVGTNLRLQEQRHAWLDMVDGQLFSREMAGALQGEPAEQTKGVTIAPMNTELIRQMSKDSQMRKAVPLPALAAVSPLSEAEQAMLDEIQEEPVAVVAQETAQPDPFAMLDDPPEQAQQDEPTGSGEVPRGSRSPRGSTTNEKP